MLPWNPPSSFSLGNDSQPQSQPPQSGAGQPRYTSPYHDSQPSPHQQPQQQQQQQQQQQPQQQQQQQQQQNQGPPQPANAAPYPPMTLAATLHFLQSEHRRYARDRNEWEIERAEMRARIALLEGEKRGNEGALKSLGRRCKMLEMALRGERSKFLSTTNALGTGTLGLTPSVSGTASPVPHLAQTLAPPTAGAAGIPPAKLAVLQKEAGAPSTPVATTSEKESGSEKKDDVKEKDEKADEKDVPKSAPMQSSSSASGQAVPAKVESLSAANGFATGTWNNAAAAAAGLGNAGGVGAGGVRDPRGKARSREYLKQCLQEITYLTSSTTLNPLSLHSYAAPNVPRPRKSLPDHLPAPGAPGVLSIPSSSVPPSTTGIDDPLPPPLSQDKLREEELKEKEDKERKTDLLSSYPSDPPSAYVPLKRQISQPGQQGLRGVPPVGPRDAVPSLPTPPEVVIEEPTPVEGEVEAKEEEKETPAPLQDSDEFDRQIAELSSPEPLPRPTSIDSAASPSSAAAALEAEEEVLPTPIAAAATPQAAAADVVAVDELEGLPVAAAGEAVEEAEPTTPLSPGPKEGSSAEEGDKESTTTFSTSASDEAAEEALSSSPSPPSAIVPSILDDAALPAPAPLASAETTSADLDAAESAAEVGESAAKIDEEEEETPEEAFEPVGESSLKKEVEGKKEEQKETEKKEKEEELVAASDPGKQDSSIGVTSAAGGGAGVDGSRDGGEARLSREDFAEGEQGGEGGDFGLIASSAVLSESGTNGERGASAREGEAEEAEETGGGEPITALYRPASEEEWRAKLAEAGRRAYPSLHASASSAAGGGGGGDKELESLSWDLDVESPPSSEDGSVGKKTAKNGHGKKEGKKEPSEDATLTGLQENQRWRARRVLKSHLECVRAVAITEGGEVGGEVVVSGGDDGTVKVWRGVVGGKSGSRSDIEPVATLRGHTAPITALAVSSPSIIFSASLDSTIRLWRLPSPSASIYDPHDPSLALATLEPRSDAAWGIVELEKDRIAAIFADGSVQVWDWRTEEKVRGWEYCGVESSPSSFSPGGSQKKRPTALPISTCIVVLRPEFEDIFGDDDTKLEWGKEYLVVGYQNSVVKIFEAETGKEKRSFAMDETTDGTRDTQINAIAVEPYHGLIATAHEDRYIRIVEINSGQHLVSTIAHLDGVTSLSFTDPGSGSSRYRSATLASTSHDVSLRIWNVSYNYEEYPLTEIEFTCVQEASTHRVKGAEGVLGLAVREGGRVAVTAGADGTVRVWER